MLQLTAFVPGLKSSCRGLLVLEGSTRGLACKRRGRKLSASVRSYQDEQHVSSDKRRYLLKFVQTCEADLLENAPWPPEVEEAMLLTALRLLPSLPEQFKVKVQCSGKSLADLIYTSLITGYLCCMMWERLQVERSRRKLLPVESGFSGVCSEESEGKAGMEVIDAAYVYRLESEIIELRERLKDKESEARTGNSLLDFLAESDAELLHAYTCSAGPEVLEAFNTFVYRALGQKKSLSNDLLDHSSTDLGNLVFYAELVGFTLRQLEVQFESERSMLLSYSSIDGLPLTLPTESWLG